MKSLWARLRKWEFEARIFVSLSIVLFVCILSYSIYDGRSANLLWLGRLVGCADEFSETLGYLIVAGVMVLASLLRMWAGSVLSSDRVMAFRVQSDKLLTSGPYAIVRNPIYLADLIAMCGFAFCLPPTGFLLPLLIYFHYIQLVKHEEISLAERFREEYASYAARVPQLIPRLRSFIIIFKIIQDFHITQDGFGYNALYVLFVLGFITSAFTRDFFMAVIIGLPGVLDWAVAHTKKGLAPRIAQVASVRAAAGTFKTKGKKVFEDILYAQCWEDPRIDRVALQIGEQDTVFSITSGGCNTLAFLLDNPKKIVALDLSPYQNFLLELKIAAFRNLSYEELLEFLGVRESQERGLLYGRLRESLSEQARRYWDAQTNKIEGGIIHCGRYEGYMRLLRTWLRRLVGRRTLEEFFKCEEREARVRLFETKWKKSWWWIFTRVLLSRATMTLLFDKAFFRYLDRSFSFGKHFAARAEHALTWLPSKENSFLSYILRGCYSDDRSLPIYLRKENYAIIRDRVDRIEIITESCDRYFARIRASQISKFNFSNIFEWMSPTAFENLLRETIRVATDGAIIAYRNLLVRRERPEALAGNIRPLRSLASALYRSDLSFIYSNYVVEQIQKELVRCHIPSKMSSIAAK